MKTTFKLFSKVQILLNKKASQNLKGFLYFYKNSYSLLNLAYLFLNLSIRPAVSISLDLPV
jgi:hypothetical protein